TSEIPQAYLHDTPRIARAENAADGQKAPPDAKRSWNIRARQAGMRSVG
ncbi:unnamed protein product, partial [marine sediment metagenome]